MSTHDITQVDFSHPEIMLARAQVYALLLQWRKERATYTCTLKEQSGTDQDELNRAAHELDMSGILHTTEEGPASALTETGLR
jgi:hypothetical protein